MKKKGLTLIELVVTISITTIFLGTLLTSFYFINKINKDVITNASNLYKIASLKDYIIKNKITTNDFIINNGDIKHNNKDICLDTTIKEINFITKDKYKYCIITYNELEKYEFIITKEVI